MKNKISIDLHLHFDGSVSLLSARELADMQNISLPSSDGELRKLLTVSDDCRNLAEYLEKFAFPLSLLQTKEAIEKGMNTLCRELIDSGTIYAEIRFAPQLHVQKGLSQSEVVKAAIKGFKSSKLLGGLILCCMRGDNNTQENMETVGVAQSFLGKGVLALDLAGNEAAFPTKGYKELFALAKENKVPFTIHAGEADGAASIKAAIDMGALRIGHGVRSVEDKEVLDLLALKQIPLEICPTSNLNTNIYANLSELPLKALFDAGIIVTVNSDNRSVSNTDSNREISILSKEFSLTVEEEKILLQNSVRAAFCDEKTKNKLNTIIENKF